ncbi:MAG: hypothetical protein C3F13_02880 [Anaerolineales bacterium]|nr:MAG: hypothetical protein C3F13_02880 [Anaerolineales bacterium]
MNKPLLATLISNFVRTTPSETVQEVIIEIQKWQDPSTIQRTKLLSLIHGPQTKAKLVELLDCWISTNPQMNSQCFAFCINSSLHTYQTSCISPVELIWTGPEDVPTSFRRTDQALLELISEAKEQLLVVSFAVYKAQLIIDAIERAILHNVKVTICLEDSTEAQGKISVAGSKAFSSSMFRLANFYVWPLEKRLHTQDGKFGSLHAKIAVADRKKVFISSANLTDFAMGLNMEMGVLIDDGGIGEQITRLFDAMILNSTLKKYQV